MLEKGFLRIAQEEEAERAAPFCTTLFLSPFKQWELFPPKQLVPELSVFGKASLSGSLAAVSQQPSLQLAVSFSCSDPQRSLQKAVTHLIAGPDTSF